MVVEDYIVVVVVIVVDTLPLVVAMLVVAAVAAVVERVWNHTPAHKHRHLNREKKWRWNDMVPRHPVSCVFFVVP